MGIYTARLDAKRFRFSYKGLGLETSHLHSPFGYIDSKRIRQKQTNPHHHSQYNCNTDLLRLLNLISSRGRVKPDENKSQESSNHRPQTGDPDPATANSPTARVLVVRKVAHGHLVLLLDVGEEWALVVDAEGEDAVLVRNHELSAVYSACLRAAGGLKSQAVERREHSELQLQLVLAGDLEGHPLVVGVLGHLNVEDLFLDKVISYRTHKSSEFRIAYGLVLDAVDLGVQILRGNLALGSQVMLDLLNLEDTSLLEGPSSQLLGELAVDGRSLLAAGSLDRSREPLVLQCLNRAENSEAGRVASLHGRNHIQLGTCRLNIFGRGHLLLRVVSVGSGRGSQNRCNESAITAEDLGGHTGQGKDALTIEEGLDVGAQRSWALEEEDVVLLGGRDSVVVEVVNNDSRAVARQVDIDLEEEGADGAGGGGLAGEGEEDVAVLVQEFQDVLGGQVGAETCIN